MRGAGSPSRNSGMEFRQPIDLTGSRRIESTLPSFLDKLSESSGRDVPSDRGYPVTVRKFPLLLKSGRTASSPSQRQTE